MLSRLCLRCRYHSFALSSRCRPSCFRVSICAAGPALSHHYCSADHYDFTPLFVLPAPLFRIIISLPAIMLSLLYLRYRPHSFAPLFALPAFMISHYYLTSLPAICAPSLCDLASLFSLLTPALSQSYLCCRPLRSHITI